MGTPWDDYLNKNSWIRHLIKWDGIPYSQWTTHPETGFLHGKLKKFYECIAAQEPCNFSFSQTAPPLTDGYMTADAASDLFVSHVAQSLWVEISRTVRWRLATYENDDLSLLFDSAYMFQKLSGGDMYMINEYASGAGMPTRPDKSFRFLSGTDAAIRAGASMIQNSRRETIWNIFRWMRNNLGHGVQGLSDAQMVEAYGYNGPQPVEKMFTRTVNPDPAKENWGERYWVHRGCHGAAALMVWLLRSVNIPARCWKTYIEDSPNPMHSGIDIPSECLFAPHLDDFYAKPVSLDPTLEPCEIFGMPRVVRYLGQDPRRVWMKIKRQYNGEKTRYLTPPSADDKRARAAGKMFCERCLSHPTYHFVSAYWEENIYHAAILSSILAAYGVSAKREDIEKIIAVIRAYSRRKKNMSEEERFQAYRHEHAEWEHWRGTKKAQ